MSKFDRNIVDVNRTSFTGNAKYNSRYSLTLYKKGAYSNPKTAIVILKNPASTCKSSLFFKVPISDVTDVDKTTIHLINKLFHNRKYDILITLNLFPYYDNMPSSINCIYNKTIALNQSYQANLNTIDTILKNNPYADIYCAWGNRSGIGRRVYHKAILDVYKLLQKTNSLIYMYQSGSPVSINLTQPKIKIGWLKNNNYLYPLHGLKW